MKKLVIIILVLSLLIPILVYFYLIGPASRDEGVIDFKVESGSSYLTISNSLKEKNLIKSVAAYKIYIKLNQPKPVEACTYKLSENMSVKKIVDKLSQPCNTSDNVIKVTIPEGRHLEQVAEIISELTNNSKEQLLNVWNSDEFIEKTMNEYEFITEDVKHKQIRYPLEGYFFPSTYELLNKDVTPEYIAYKMLDQMEVIYNKYKKDIENSDYTFHELLTMASIVEYEAILDEERAVIAGVFYNRINKNIKFQSCATLGYAIKEWKLVYTNADTAVDHPYNTYFYAGMPPGPGNMPSEESIKAVIKPAETEYLFFLANVCDPNNKKSVFAKTNAEHEANAKKYLCQ